MGLVCSPSFLSLPSRETRWGISLQFFPILQELERISPCRPSMSLSRCRVTGYNQARCSHFTIERGGNCLCDSERFGTSERDEKKVLLIFSKSFVDYQCVRCNNLKILPPKMRFLGLKSCILDVFGGIFGRIFGRNLAEIGQIGWEKHFF